MKLKKAASNQKTDNYPVLSEERLAIMREDAYLVDSGILDKHLEMARNAVKSEKN